MIVTSDHPGSLTLTSRPHMPRPDYSAWPLVKRRQWSYSQVRAGVYLVCLNDVVIARVFQDGAWWVLTFAGARLYRNRRYRLVRHWVQQEFFAILARHGHYATRTKPAESEEVQDAAE